MKRVIMVILAAAFLLPAMYSCKKGASDPLISLKSRAARLAGEWEITKYVWNQTAGTTTQTETFDDGMYTFTTGTTTQTGTYTWEFTIDKNGTYEFTQTITVAGQTAIYTEEGNWYFSGANKDEEIKNKEMVCFQSTRRVYNNGGTTNTFTEEGNTLSWFLLERLSNKEILGTYDYTFTGTTTTTISIEITFTQA